MDSMVESFRAYADAARSAAAAAKRHADSIKHAVWFTVVAIVALAVSAVAVKIISRI